MHKIHITDGMAIQTSLPAGNGSDILYQCRYAQLRWNPISHNEGLLQCCRAYAKRQGPHVVGKHEYTNTRKQ